MGQVVVFLALRLRPASGPIVVGAEPQIGGWLHRGFRAAAAHSENVLYPGEITGEMYFKGLYHPHIISTRPKVVT